MNTTKIFEIAVIPGDGIGKEVVPEGIRVREAAGRRFGLSFNWRNFDWSCETYIKTGRMMPEDGLEQLRPFDAVFLGAVGYPGVPDHVSLWGLLIPIRRVFNQYVNLRPVRLLQGVETLALEKGLRSPGRSIFRWCAKTVKASTRKLAAEFFRVRTAKWPFRKQFSPNWRWIGFCATRSNSRAPAVCM